MGLKDLEASRWMKTKLVMLAFGLSLSVSLLAQEITPGNGVSAESPSALPLTEEERLWLKEHPTLRVAVKNGWMPVEFQLENQKHKGVSIQYLEKISHLTGLALTIVDFHDNLSTREATIITGVRGLHAPDGFTKLDLPYLETPNAIYTASDNTELTTNLQLSDLANKKVAVFRGGPLPQALKTLVPGIKLKLVDIADEAFEYLAAGSVDAYVGNELVLDYHLDFHKISSVKKSGITPLTSQVFMGASAHEPVLVNILNKATQQIGTNPHDILENWRRKPSENSVSKYMFSAVAFFAVLLLLQLVKLYRSNKKQARAAQQEIWFQANHDFLTKLPNRFQLKNVLQKALQAAHQDQHALGVMIIDVDNFKEINDTAGHAMGDEVLIKIAERIQSIIAPPNIVARFGGDEFLIVIKHAHNGEQLSERCAELVKAMLSPLTVQEKSFSISISLGAALFPDNSHQADELIMFADQALYQAKKTGKNKYVLFDASMHEVFSKRMLLNSELKHAIARKQLFLHYQPIFNLSSLRCEKVEALLRWQHPDFGLVPPDVFIKIAEESGYIIELGEWVFAQVLSDAGYIIERLGQIEICINISPLQFAQPSTIDLFLSQVSATGIPGKYFCLEITEGLLLEPSKHVSDTLNNIHDHGLKLAIDDFGTGYSSLAYLNKFKIDYVKIDKSFIRNITENPNDQALCKTMIFMGKQLNIHLIAEGVETLAQEKVLQDMGCQYSQGYFRGVPVRLKDL